MKKLSVNPKTDARAAKPFLKWAGGKSQLLRQFDRYYPEELKQGKIERYVEPFIGGGAVFFDVMQRYAVRRAYLQDINEELIIAYRVIQKHPKRLIKLLEGFSKQYRSLDDEGRQKFYYEIRERYNSQRLQIDYKNYAENWIPRAAQLIFLNRTCFNGLFRLNRSGEFNVPFGRYKNPRILDERNILKVSEILQIAEIRSADFEACETFVDEKSFVYFDPPYRPISRTSSFTSYSKNEFGEHEQIRLSRFFSRLDRTSSAKLMLSNSDPSNENPDDGFFKELYQGYTIRKVMASRMINSDGEKRGQIYELVITNYPLKAKD